MVRLLASTSALLIVLTFVTAAGVVPAAAAFGKSSSDEVPLEQWTAGRHGAWSSVTPAAPLNLLVISLDTTRRDRLSCYGFTKPTSPNLDRLAAEGILFENPVSPVPVTLPSHTSIFTGLYPFQHQVRNNGFYVAGDSLVTLAELLRGRGYATGAALASFTLEHRFGLDQGFDSYEDRFGAEGVSVDLELAQRGAREITELSLAWIEAHQGGPFFFFAHYFDPHAPYHPPEPFATQFANDPYAGEIALMDDAIGELIEGLRTRGLLEKTIILVVGDHGEGLGDHGEKTHTTFIYQSTQSVPFLARFPRVAPFDGRKWQGRKIDGLVSLVDLLPTAWNALGFPREALPPIAGRSLVPMITDNAGGHPWVYCETLVPDLEYGAADLRGLIDAGGWKYIRAPRPELFDLNADPGESSNLQPREPARAKEMDLALAALLRREPGVSAPRAMDQETLERLKSLGYLGGTETGGATKPDLKDIRWVQHFVAQAEGKAAMGQPAEALKLVDSVLAVYPGTRVALRDRASFLYRLGKHRESLAAYDVALQNCAGCPEESRLRQDRAIVASDAGQHEVALKEVRDLIAKRPDEPGLHQLLGEVLQAKGDTSGARRAYNDEARIAPTNPTALLALARLAAQRGRPQEAEAAFRRAIAANPNHTDAALELCDFLAQAKRFSEAEEIVGKLLVANPKHPAANAQMGFLCSATNRVDLAVEYLNRSLAVRPNHPGTLANLGAVYKTSGRGDKAFEVLKACLATGQAPQPAYANLGICYAERGDLDRAITLWEQGLALDPKSQAAAAIKQNLTRAKGMKQGK